MTVDNDDATAAFAAELFARVSDSPAQAEANEPTTQPFVRREGTLTNPEPNDRDVRGFVRNLFGLDA